MQRRGSTSRSGRTEMVLKEIRPRCFSSRSGEWRYISRDKRCKSTSRHRGGGGPVAPSSSSSAGSSSSDPPSPVRAYRPRSFARRPGRVGFDLGLPRDEAIPESMLLLTWNVEAFAPQIKPRMAAVLRHIQDAIFECPNGEQPEPCCILLQEVAAAALPVLLEHRWVREHFVVVPTKAEHWPRPDVGNVTLVARTVPVLAAHTLAFAPRQSPMRRHALFVDVRLGAAGAGSESDDSVGPGGERTLRLANVHLESLAEGAAHRPWQLRATANMLANPRVHAGVVAGDMNAIMPEDGMVPAWAGLADAWTGIDLDGRGNTWGYQPPAKGCEPGRLDKVLYVPNGGCEVDRPERVGVGVKTAAGQWASDHFGLLTTVRVLA